MGREKEKPVSGDSSFEIFFFFSKKEERRLNGPRKIPESMVTGKYQKYPRNRRYIS